MSYLIIEGFMGSGKGAVGKTLAKQLNIPLIDLDKLISERLKMSTMDIYDRFGEPYYRAMETMLLKELSGFDAKAVLVLGSAAAMLPKNQEYLKNMGHVYYIQRKLSGILEQMKSKEKHSWIHDENWNDRVAKIYKEREPFYKKTADTIIDGEGKSVQEIADLIIETEEKE